ncbi:MAG: anthranilate synthase component I family protein, partial [Prevotella sp.]|nr:anthranilate synthase component I family protein [Prevotella sp.]
MDNSKTNTFAYTTTVSSMLADLHTPVGVYLRLRDLGAVSVLMESSDYHDKDNSRSFIGVNPLASIAVAHGRIECSYPDGTRTVSSPDEQLDSSCIADAFNAFLQR